MRCINCGIETDRCNTIGKQSLEDGAILALVREWKSPETVNKYDIICQACLDVAHSTLEGNRTDGNSTVGHRRLCILCGRSLLRRIRFHELRTTSEQESRIRDIIIEWVLPRIVVASSAVCHSCWCRARKASQHFHSGSSISAGPSNRNISQQETPIQHPEQPTGHVATIVLPNYYRAVETENRCFVEGCLSPERNRITFLMRQELLKMCNFYIPPNNRLCNIHKTWNSWEFLNRITDYTNSFTATHIEDMLSLKNENRQLMLNYENIN